MDLSFANPAGFWALLGLPAIVAIHFLQRRSKPQVITTLFLLEMTRRESETGHRFERLRTSIPFWLQLLMVLLLTWLLVEPRWLKSESIQRTVVVMDASASMQASRKEAVEAVAAELSRLAPLARTQEYTVLTTAPESPSLYHGTDRGALVKALETWQPWLGTHDATPQLAVARSLTGREGVVLLVTDRPPEGTLPYDAKHLSVGEPFDNVGFTGMALEEKDDRTVVKAMLRNFGAAPQRRTWWFESGERKSPATPVDLAPGQSQTLAVPWPDDFVQGMLVLSADRFTADDRMPLVRPRVKSLGVALPAGQGGNAGSLVDVFRAFQHTHPATKADDTDMVVQIYDPLAPALPDVNACVFAADPQPEAKYLPGILLAATDPLVEGLNWQSLLVRETIPIPAKNGDRTLLWLGERPLVAERRTPAGSRQLLFNFDLTTTNARKLPAFAVLLHRFIESLRAAKVAPESVNVTTHQKLQVATRPGAAAPPVEMTVTPLAAGDEKQPTPRKTTLRAGDTWRAPDEPSFFTMTQGNDTLLTAAAHFADPRESDFLAAKTAGDTAGIAPALVQRHGEADPNWRLWLLVLFATLLASWWFGTSRERKPVPAAAA